MLHMALQELKEIFSSIWSIQIDNDLKPLVLGSHNAILFWKNRTWIFKGIQSK